MGKYTSIEWTHHTFNPWWGCSKVSEACRECYAEKWSKRTGNCLWGKDANRRFFGDKHWDEPLKWNREAEKLRERRRVFCASMADVFEDREDLKMWRDRLWSLITQTTMLDWLLLTKRPENIGRMVPWQRKWPTNVWLGATVEDQENAERRIPEIFKYNAHIHFISGEPLLGPININPWIDSLDWVIIGGESGSRARPTHPVWIYVIRDLCVSKKKPFFFKQWGSWRPITNGIPPKAKTTVLVEKGLEESLVKLSKKKAGKDLDGKIWMEVPS